MAAALVASVSDWLPQTVAACASSVAAIAAWMSAVNSRRTSQDALAALAISIRPRLKIHVYRDKVIVGNTSEWDALNVAMEVLMDDGERLDGFRRERLPRGATRGGQVSVENLTVSFDPRTEPEAQPVKKVTVYYSDSRQIARYQLETTYNGHPSFTTDEKISGP